MEGRYSLPSKLWGLRRVMKPPIVYCNPGTTAAGQGIGVIISKIKHAIKLKTSPARLAQLLQPSL